MKLGIALLLIFGLPINLLSQNDRSINLLIIPLDKKIEQCYLDVQLNDSIFIFLDHRIEKYLNNFNENIFDPTKIVISKHISFFNDIVKHDGYFLIENQDKVYKLFNGYTNDGHDIMVESTFIGNGDDYYLDHRRYLFFGRDGIELFIYSLDHLKVYSDDTSIRLIFVYNNELTYSNWVDLSKLKYIEEKDYPTGF